MLPCRNALRWLPISLVLACTAVDDEPGSDPGPTEGTSATRGATAASEASEDEDGPGGADSSDGGSTAGDPTSASSTGAVDDSGGPPDDDDDDDDDASTSSAESSGDGTPPPDCAAYDDCEACGAEDGCGWCGATGTCTAGDGEGPDAGSCSGGWVIEGDFFSCPAANCFGRTTCGECQDAFTGCGWCASTGTCMAGAPDMPAAPAECPGDQWYFDICPADCADEMTCVSCEVNVGCGWCGASGGCVAGTDAGPLEGACAGGWTSEVGDCF